MAQELERMIKKLTQELTNISDVSSELKIKLSDGKTLITRAQQSSGNNFPNHILVVARYNQDGSLDQTFGTKGIWFMEIHASSLEPVSLKLLANGKILVEYLKEDRPIFAYQKPNIYTKTNIVRLTSDGNFDENFGFQLNTKNEKLP